MLFSHVQVSLLDIFVALSEVFQCGKYVLKAERLWQMSGKARITEEASGTKDEKQN